MTLDFNDPKVNFAFNVNMMCGELIPVIRDHLSPPRCKWEGAHPDLQRLLQQLDRTIGDLNKLSEDLLISWEK